jgi:LptD protein/OstA-like protein
MAFFLGLLFTAAPAFASSFEIESLGDKHHVTADRTLYHSREKVYEAFGHVVVSSQGRRLACDYLWFDENTRDAKARGNVIFVNANSTIDAAELDLNLDTGLGAIFYGKVYNDLYTLKGQLIRRVAVDRYLTTEGEYTTCKDCAESWKMSASNVDLTMDGYAFMDNVFVKIKDVSAVYLPYLVMPVKNRRQTGLLFPRMGASSNNGFVFVQPLFIAIDEHQDATLALGRYSARGLRYEGEYRYKSYDGIGGSLNYYHITDRTAGLARANRDALRSVNEWPFFRHFGMRWRALEVSDRDYPLDFQEDIQGLYLPDLESNVIAQAPFDDFFFSAEAKRYRNMLYDAPTGFDTGMVQDAPAIYAGVKERKLAGPVLWSATGRYDDFIRGNGSFFDANGNGTFDPPSSNGDRIRTARRSIFTPELSAPFRLGPYLSLAPSVQYNNIHYDFSLPSGSNVGPTTTQYLQWQVEASTTLRRVYDYNGEKVTKLEHQLTPFMTFSNIPWINNDSTHPFQQQLKLPNGSFDEFDIVPMSNDSDFLRIPQGKSFYYGVTSRLIRKLRRPDETPRPYPFDLLPTKAPKVYPTPLNRKQELSTERERLFDEDNPHYENYQEIWNVNMAQAFDFKEAQAHQDDKLRAFSYFMTKSSFNIENFSHDLEYRFYPRMVRNNQLLPGQTTLQAPASGLIEEKYDDRHWVTTSLTWYWTKLMNLRKTRLFERSLKFNFTATPKLDPSGGSRSIGGTLSWSFNDFVNLKLQHSYDLLTLHTVDWGAVATVTHPSECWGLILRYDWNRSRGTSGTNSKPNELGFELLLNLTGTGFMNANSVGKDNNGSGVFGGT